MRGLLVVITICLLGINAAWGDSEQMPGRPHLRVANREVAEPSLENIKGMVDRVRVHAFMSDLACRNYSGGKSVADQVRSKPGEKAEDLADRQERAKRWAKYDDWLKERNWEFQGNNKLKCESNLDSSNETDAVKRDEHLEFDVWVNRSTVPPQVVVAFRGTDDGADSASNTTAVRPEHRSEDQYAKLHAPVVKEKVVEACKAAGPGAIVTTTGHSLGGGLAQHLFYASQAWAQNYVNTAVVFDPSPMTGWRQSGTAVERTRAMSNFNATLAATLRRWRYPEVMAHQYRFGTIRVNEGGEVLSYLNTLASGGEPEDPYMAVLNFDFEDGNSVSQHSISDLAHNLLYFPAAAPVPPHVAAARKRAAEESARLKAQAEPLLESF